MARNRMIKPEFWSDEKTGMQMSSDEKCLYIGMWNFADDEGLINGNPIYLKSSIFPYDNNIMSDKIEEYLNNLVKIEILFRYKKNHQPYIWIVNFRKHQRIDRPQKPQNPCPSIQNNNYHMAIFRRDNFICHICGEYTDISDEINFCNSKTPSIDHVKPKSKGGTDYPSNLKTACISCNKSKKNCLAPCDKEDSFDDHSTNTRRSFDEHSTNDRDQRKGKEKEGKRKERESHSTNTRRPFDEHSTNDDAPSPFFEISSDEQSHLNNLCHHLEKQKIFPEASEYVKEVIYKRNINPRAVIHALEKICKKKKFDDTRGGVKAYFQRIIVVENGNYNEADFIENHNKLKNQT